jgi:polar amino acid transport system permease protein
MMSGIPMTRILPATIPRHRIVLGAIGIALVLACVLFMDWSWLANPKYARMIPGAIFTTIWLLVVTVVLGLVLAIALGFAQAAGPRWLAVPSAVFCTVIRGTPLLLQIWLLYYGLGALFPQYPWIRDTWIWSYLRDAWPYAVVALTISYAGYEGEVMRGAFRSVPRGQLEAARAMGMPRLTMFRRIWLPQALQKVLPTLGGETVLQLKATPLVATITVEEIYSVASRVRQDTYIIYEPLFLLAVVYLVITACIVLLFRWLESLSPTRVA